jgi:hypothetical protein
VAADLTTKTVKIGYEPPATPEKIEELLTEINYAPAK